MESGNKYESEGRMRSEQRMMESLAVARVSRGDWRWSDDKDRHGAW